ncbi:MAG: hemin uptake protein HemP [Burkholderiales bacterium]|nr:hemin uptake protein HemP [Burkholderiales bacterium]
MTAPGRPPVDPQRPTSAAAEASAPAPSAKQPAGPIASDVLFAGANEVQIVHRGSLYRLKQTALGKLILTK